MNFLKPYGVYLLALALVLLIFLFIPTKSQKSQSATTVEKAAGLSLEEYRDKYFQGMSTSLKQELGKIEAKISSGGNDSLAKVNAFSELIAFYNKHQSLENSALAVYQKASLIKNPNSWLICGDNFMKLMLDQQVDSNVMNDLGKKAIASYESSINLDSNLIEAKLKLAECYMEIGGQPMKGVAILKGIVDRDQNNIPAQFLLAKFGLVSAQYDKVLTRTDKILSLQPQNVDARLMRIDANAQLGNKDKAIEDLQFLVQMKNLPKEMKAQMAIAIKELEKK